MKHFRTVLTATIIVLLSGGLALAQPQGDEAAKMKQANADLDMMAQEISRLCTQPGFRGFLRSEIAKSKNQENIIELEKFLAKASKQKGMPPGLAKLKDSSGKAKGRIKDFGVSEKIDLYIPVEAHRAKWKGGKDFLVASSPVNDEKDNIQIVAYSVRDGKRVILDPIKVPSTVVLVVAPCEHITHEKNIIVADDSPPPQNLKPARKITSPPGKIYENEKTKKGEVGKYPSNSRLYVYYTWFKNDREDWWSRGNPEIEVYVMQECGGQRSFKRFDMVDANATYTSHYTGKYGYLNFYSNCSDVTVTLIYERDGGSWIKAGCYTFPSGRTHCYNKRKGDDWVAGTPTNQYCNSGIFYKSAFPNYSVYGGVDMGCYGSVQPLKKP